MVSFYGLNGCRIYSIRVMLDDKHAQNLDVDHLTAQSIENLA